MRRFVVAVALCGLLAGCATSKPAPTALDRSVCKTLHTFGPMFAMRPVTDPLLPKLAVLEHGDASTAQTFVGADFVWDLIQSGDSTFRRLGQAQQRGTGSPGPFRQLYARCSALGL